MKKTFFALLLALASLPFAQAEMPKITGTPVLDTPANLDWPLDSGRLKPSLHTPTGDTLYDFHGNLEGCDLLLSSEGNYHMALHDIWPIFLAKFKNDPLRNALYTTSPPVVEAQLENHTLQFDNLSIGCRPSVAVASQEVMQKLAAAGLSDGTPQAIYSDRGIVILVKKGNPKHIKTIWDLGRKDVHLVTPNHIVELGAYRNYQNQIYNIALADTQPPKNWTADKLINAIYNGQSENRDKWLEGKNIHHRDEPWSVAYGKADAAVILYHLGRYTQETFPEIFDIVPLGGTVADPQPLPGTKVGTGYVVGIKGNWSAKQLAARKALIDTLMSAEFTTALEKHGLTRPK